MTNKISENLIYEVRRKVLMEIINIPEIIILFNKYGGIFPSSIRVLRMIILREAGFKLTDYRSS
jgi:hypothetical protein